MVRVLTGISILWFLIPGYAFAIGISFVVPKLYTAIASFDAKAALLPAPSPTKQGDILCGRCRSSAFEVAFLMRLFTL